MDAATKAVIFFAGFTFGALICLLLSNNRDEEPLFDEEQKPEGALAPRSEAVTATQPDQALTSFFGDVVIQPS